MPPMQARRFAAWSGSFAMEGAASWLNESEPLHPTHIHIAVCVRRVAAAALAVKVGKRRREEDEEKEDDMFGRKLANMLECLNLCGAVDNDVEEVDRHIDMRHVDRDGSDTK